MATGNPCGLDGIEFIEFASRDRSILEHLMQRSGMTLVARHKTKRLSLYRQSQINFVINEDPESLTCEFL